MVLVKTNDFPGRKIDILKQWLMATDMGKGKADCRTIAICNQKGGVGKTVTAINLSAVLAACCRRTLLIDLDPQGHSGVGFGLDTESLERSVYNVLMNGTCHIGEAIVPLRPNLGILPSNIELAGAELEMARFERRERRLKERIDELRDRYEYVVIDCPPSVGILTVNALVASQTAIVPVNPACFSIHGLSKVIDIVDALRETFLLDLRVFALITFFEQQPKEAQVMKELLENMFGSHLLRTVVRKNAKLNEATRKGVPIFEYDRYCSGSRDYLDLAKEVLSIESRSTRGDGGQGERGAWTKPIVDESQQTDNPEGSRDPDETFSEDLRRSEIPEVAEDERGFDMENGTAQGRRQKIRLVGIILIILIGFFVLFVMIRKTGQKVEPPGGVRDTEKPGWVQKEPVDEHVVRKPDAAVPASEETVSTLHGSVETEKNQVALDSSPTEVPEAPEIPVVAPGAETLEPVGAKIEETEEQLSSLQESEVSIPEGASLEEPEEITADEASLKEREEPMTGLPAIRGRYTVNLASFREKARADRYVANLEEQDLDVFGWEIELPEKGKWYRVSAGNFSTLEEAQRFAKDLEARGFKTFVAKLPSAQSQSSDTPD
jgi:chromosome partitioning protein